MFRPSNRFFFVLFAVVLTTMIVACSSGKKVVPETNQVHAFAPALSPADRLIQFVQTGESYLLNGIFSDSVLNRMSINEMVKTRNDFVRSFGKLMRAEGPEYDSDTTATLILYHEDMILAANLIFDKRGLIKDIAVKRGLGDEQLGSF